MRHGLTIQQKYFVVRHKPMESDSSMISTMERELTFMCTHGDYTTLNYEH